MKTTFLLFVSLFIVFCSSQDHWILGTSSNSILPPINGRTDYVSKKTKKNKKKKIKNFSRTNAGR